MSLNIRLNELQTHLERAKDRLSQEREALLALCPLEDHFSREEYAFSYVRAENIGMQAINRRLEDVAWLPMQLDPEAEVMSDKRAALKRWLASPFKAAPDAEDFGNDFIHVLARCGMHYGWSHPGFFKSAVRIANLFRDLSCLIGLVYYGTWLNENRIESLRLSDPEDLCRTAQEVTTLIQSPEMHRLLQQRDQHERRVQKAAPPPALETRRKQARPVLRVITNDAFVGDGARG